MNKNNIITVKNAEGDPDTQAEIIIQNKIDYIPKVSVIIPVYNVEEYLRECLDSVVNQTLKEIEIICVDDGSTDNSLEILKEYATKDKRMTVIKQENKGAGIARNCAINAAKGEFIAFMDSDDMYPKNKTLETMFVKAVENNVFICGGSLFNLVDNQLVTDASLIPNSYYYSFMDKKEGIIDYSDYQYDYCYWRFIYKRNFLIENKIYFPDYKRFQDPPFFVKAMAKAKKFYGLKEATYIYRKSYKQVIWTEEKIYHLLQGLRDNLILSVEYNFNKLYNRTLNRIKIEYKTIIAKEESERIKNVQKEIMEICLEKAKSNFPNSTILPKVSVIMPCYNTAQYLHQALDSVVNQTLKDIEIICVNDGSTDNTLDIIKEYAAKDFRIKYIDKPNAGYGQTMNCGIDSATGEYIGILEPDDYLKLNMYETLYNKVKELDLDIIKADYYQFEGEKNQEKYKYTPVFAGADKTYYNRLLNPATDTKILYAFSTTWAGIYRRSFIEKFNIRHNETPGASYQDNGFWAQTMYLAKRIYFLNSPFYYYRQDNSNQSMKKRNNVWTIPIEYDFIDKVFDKHDELKSLKAIYVYRKYCAYLYHMHQRLDEEYWTEYLERMSKEFDLHINKKEFDDKYYSKKQLADFKLIITGDIKKYIQQYGKVKNHVIISLTSYPARINTVNKTIETLLNQSMKADKVILWLAPEQFPNKEKDLPPQLLALCNKGLTIDWYHDIKSYKKLIPALKKYPDSMIITADDDLKYDKNWLKILYDSYIKNPEDINCHRAHGLSIDNNGDIKPYTKWKSNIRNAESSYLNFCTSGAGILYPPHCFNNEIFNETMFKALCKNADDIWFWAMCVLNNKKIRIVNNNISRLNIIDNTQETALWNTNIINNDRYLANVLEAYPEVKVKLLTSQFFPSPLLFKDIGFGCNTWCEPKTTTGNDIKSYTYDLSDNIYTRYVSWDPIKEGSCDVEIRGLFAIEKRSKKIVEFPVNKIVSSGKIIGNKVEFRNQKGCWIGCTIEGAFESFTIEAKIKTLT